MKKITPEDWIPADGLKLEANALATIRETRNTLVVAGPGSGKTELLAQKACYLLQTGTCPHPRRILAISFKRDAAFNIKERVNRRCGQLLSQRFDSYTFDKFAKQMVDRFRNGLLDPYKVPVDYELLVETRVVNSETENAFRSADYTYFNTHNVKGDFLTRTPLPHNVFDVDDAMRQKAWAILAGEPGPKLTFPMVMRLAQYIMVTNDPLRSFLQQTYSHVFLDEFQDTTFLQYDLLRVCFNGSGVNYTAVGDDKQTIMKWAGAIPGIFSRYIKDHSAELLPLTMNFRSAPKLVSLQNYLVKHLLGKTDFAIPSPDWGGGPGEARMCFFESQVGEIRFLVDEIVSWVRKENLPPREICILVKQTPPKYTQELIDALTSAGIQARDETILQDLLCEDVIGYVVNVLTVIVSGRYGTHSDEAFNFLCNINSSYDDLPLLRLKTKFIKFCDEHRGKYPGTTLTDKQLWELIIEIIKFAGISKIRIAFPQYGQGRFLEKVVTDFFKHLNGYYTTTRDLLPALDAVLGKHSIPVMTAHKSKGLEYHSVIFIGLEDGAFWTYNQQKDSDDNLVFVALSRAKERVLFTFCSNRGGPQRATDIKVIHDLLKNSPDVTVVYPDRK
ncbi:MAG: ATP-dependent helicase [Puia sp.]|nr:ATP-dependent helicase [Puia sp.]